MIIFAIRHKDKIYNNNRNNIMFRKILALSMLFVFISFELNYSQQSTDTQQIGSHLDLTSNDSLKSILSLQANINALLNDKNLKGANYGLAIYSTINNKSIYKRNSEKLLTPASNTKIFTSFALLNFLGENFNTRTSVYCKADAIQGNAINGDIYLFGRGDINLSIGDIEDLAQQIRNLGITQINGNICADASFFDKDYARSSYSGDREEVEPTGPIFPLTVENNLINVLVKAGSRTGGPANIQIIPNSKSFIVRNNSLVGFVAKKKKKAAPAGIGVRITNENDKTIITINGIIPPKQTAYYSYFNNAPDVTAAGVLKERLAVVGVKVSGDVKAATLGEIKNNTAKEIANFERPITDIMYWVNKKSDNFLAEMLFKIIGGNFAKYPSTAQSAREKVMQALNDNGIPHNGFQLNDGCGLSRRNLVSAEGLAKLLLVAKNKKFGRALDSTMTIAGVDGTLRKRMVGTLAANNLHGKTGTLSNTSSLSGYVRSSNGEQFTFAFIFNGPGVGYYKQVENKIGELLANFKYLKY